MTALIHLEIRIAELKLDLGDAKLILVAAIQAGDRQAELDARETIGALSEQIHRLNAEIAQAARSVANRQQS